jgi:hypothetical protein
MLSINNRNQTADIGQHGDIEPSEQFVAWVLGTGYAAGRVSSWTSATPSPRKAPERFEGRHEAPDPADWFVAWLLGSGYSAAHFHGGTRVSHGALIAA